MFNCEYSEDSFVTSPSISDDSYWKSDFPYGKDYRISSNKKRRIEFEDDESSVWPEQYTPEYYELQASFDYRSGNKRCRIDHDDSSDKTSVWTIQNTLHDDGIKTLYFNYISEPFDNGMEAKKSKLEEGKADSSPTWEDLFQFIDPVLVTDPETVIAPTNQDMITAPIVSHKPRRSRRRRADVSMVVNGSKITYSCSKCSQTFSTEPRLKIHEHSHKNRLNNFNNNKVVEPPMVHRSLDEPQSETSTHLQSHKIPKQIQHNQLGDKPFSCPLCNRGFSLKHGCLAHLVTQVCTRADSYLTPITGCWECNTCKKVFSVRDQAERHIRMHDTGRGIQCPVCSEDFTGAKPHGLVKHVKYIHPEYLEGLGLNGSNGLGNKPFTCPLCNRGFKGKHDLLVHLVNEVCTKIVKYLTIIEGCWECNTCKKVFSDRDQAEYHIRKHESGRGTQCPVCSEDFTGHKHPHALVRHVKYRHPEYLKDLGF